MDVISIVSGFVAQYPIIASGLFVIGGCRVIFKPVFSLLRTYVDYTPNPADNLILDKVEASKGYKAVAWVLDFTASIKLPVK